MALSFRFAVFVACLALVAGCTTPAEVGEPCTDSADCAEGLSCITNMAMDVEPVCMTDCDLTATTLCEDGAVCTPVPSAGRPADLGVCLLGGDTAVGEACTSNFECTRGAICVSLADGTQTCRRACDVEAETGCDEGETCAALSGGGGFCQPSE